jgi:hypothetical protein
MFRTPRQLLDSVLRYKLIIIGGALMFLGAILALLSYLPRLARVEEFLRTPGLHAFSVGLVLVLVEYLVRRDNAELLKEAVNEAMEEHNAQLGELVSSSCNTAISEAFRRSPIASAESFPASDRPDGRFGERFANALGASNSYYVECCTASYASYRLCRLLSAAVRSRKLDVRILLVDPRETPLVKARAELTLAHLTSGVTKRELEEGSEHIRKSVFTTIVALYEIQDILRVNVRLHKHFVFSRSELFDGGMFLSYYDGARPFPGSAFYPSESNVYTAYRRRFLFYYEAGEVILPLAEQSDEALAALLKRLGCTHSVETLRQFVDERFRSYSGLMAA